jgi:hypothetical protein
MIAYAFPPEGSAGAYRPLRFVRHLAHMGWRASVISVDANQYERYDPGLLDLIPPGTEIVRVRSSNLWEKIQARRARRAQEIAKRSSHAAARLEAAHRAPVRSLLRGAVRKLEAWCYHPDAAMCWIRPAVKATLKLCKQERPSVIWATAGPVSSFIVARRVSRRTGVPYVLDFRDAWTITFNEFEACRPKWARRLDQRAMFRLLKGAQAVIFRYDTEAECFRRAYQGALEASRIHIIPNGYEGEIDKSTPPQTDKCTLLYTGTLSSYRYDSLLEALVQLKRCDPARARLLRVTFVGEAMEPLAREIATLGLEDIVEITPSVPHAEAVEKQRQAHALLLLGRPPSMKGYELFAGAKLFDYLKGGRPIIGVLPNDETRKILHRVGVTTIADAGSSSEIVCVLYRLVETWLQGRLNSLLPDPSKCEPYSAERQTETLIRALEGRYPREPFVPGAAQIPPSLRDEIAERQWLASEARE